MCDRGLKPRPASGLPLRIVGPNTCSPGATRVVRTGCSDLRRAETEHAPAQVLADTLLSDQVKAELRGARSGFRWPPGAAETTQAGSVQLP